MTAIIGGLVSGLLSSLAVVFLIEKMGRIAKSLLFGHYILIDIIATVLAYIFMPVVGLATMVNVSVFCLVFTSYLYWRRGNSIHFTLLDLIKGNYK